jgi:hypothetical protein
MPWFENEIVDFDMTSSVGNHFEVTTHFATHADGGCDLGRWLLEIETCEHPEHRKVYELSLISVDWRVCPTSRGLGKMLGVRRYAVVVDVMVVKGTGGY